MNIRSAILAVSTTSAALAVTLLAIGPSAADAHTISPSQRAEAAARLNQGHGGGTGTCFSNLGDVSQVGIVSQNFGPDKSTLDSQGADDFTLRTKCRVSTVGIDSMVFDGVATSFTVTFYKDKHGLPGKVVAAATSDQVGGCPPQAACDTAITLPSAVTLKKGVGWVSVQANLDFGEGNFVWLTGLSQRGQPAVWENPGDGWGTGCTTWASLQSCWGSQSPGPDFEFALLK